MILEALADRLTSDAVATVGTNLFIGLMPDAPNTCVALYEYAGASPLEVMRDDTATLERPGIQVLVRAGRNDYPAARTLMEAVRDSLTAITDETISGVRILRVQSLSAINATGLDEKDRPQFTLSLQATTER